MSEGNGERKRARKFWDRTSGDLLIARETEFRRQHPDEVINSDQYCELFAAWARVDPVLRQWDASGETWGMRLRASQWRRTEKWRVQRGLEGRVLATAARKNVSLSTVWGFLGWTPSEAQAKLEARVPMTDEEVERITRWCTQTADEDLVSPEREEGSAAVAEDGGMARACEDPGGWSEEDQPMLPHMEPPKAMAAVAQVFMDPSTRVAVGVLSESEECGREVSVGRANAMLDALRKISARGDGVDAMALRMLIAIADGGDPLVAAAGGGGR